MTKFNDLITTQQTTVFYAPDGTQFQDRGKCEEYVQRVLAVNIVEGILLQSTPTVTKSDIRRITNFILEHPAAIRKVLALLEDDGSPQDDASLDSLSPA